MARGKLAKVTPLRRDPEPPASKRSPLAQHGDAAIPAVATATIESFDAETNLVQMTVGTSRVTASLDPPVSPLVVQTAVDRRERVIAQLEEGAWVVLGALRTAPTPGVDVGDEYVIRARRIAVEAEHRFSIVSGAASVVVGAIGKIEMVGETIGVKARSVAKIIGHVIRLN